MNTPTSITYAQQEAALLALLDHTPPADPIAYIWRNPTTGEEWTLDPQDVAVVYPGTEHAARPPYGTLGD